MDITEIITGNRVISSAMTVGGVRRDLKETDIPKIKSMLSDLRNKVPFYKQIYENEPSLKMRMQKVGNLSRADALWLVLWRGVLAWTLMCGKMSLTRRTARFLSKK